jgi:hypothetical protein
MHAGARVGWLGFQRGGAHRGLVGDDLVVEIGGGGLERVGDSVGEMNGDTGVL